MYIYMNVYIIIYTCGDGSKPIITICGGITIQ